MGENIRPTSSIDVKPILKKTTGKQKKNLPTHQPYDDGDSSKKKDEVPMIGGTKQRPAKRQRWEEMGRVKPRAEDRDSERRLTSIATRGVVQLFNAVKQHQTGAKNQLGKARGVRQAEKALEKATTSGRFLKALEKNKRPRKNRLEFGSQPSVKSEENSDFQPIEDIKLDVDSKRKIKRQKRGEDLSKWKVFRDDFLTSDVIKT